MSEPREPNERIDNEQIDSEEMDNEPTDNAPDSGVTRRSFIKAAAVIGGVTAVGALARDPLGHAVSGMFYDAGHGAGTTTDNYGPDQVIYTQCEQCNTFCTIKAVLVPGAAGATSLVRKIAGNPYSPLNTQPFGAIPYDTAPTEATRGIGNLPVNGRSLRGGRTCLKGQAGIQTVLDTHRITAPLKRVGPRGSGRWQTISWEQAVSEILDGAPDLGTPGLRQLWAYAPQKQVMDDWDQVKKGTLTQQDFDKKYRNVLIDTRHPDFGPKANQIAFIGGDRGELVFSRMVTQGLGSINSFNHSGVCGATGVTANARSHTGKTQKTRMYADLDNVEYLIVWGTEPLTANRGPTWLAPRITNGLQRGMQLVVVDPRMSKTAEKAHRWVPVRPGGDGALAMGMARWIVDNRTYDERYLRAPGQAAAKAIGEPTWSDATHLINLSDPKRPKVRLKDLGQQGDDFVVLRGASVGSAAGAELADLEVAATLTTPKGPINVKTAFSLLKERLAQHSMDDYAQQSGIDAQTIATLAKEFTSHGKRAVITSFRGPAMHANGYYHMRALNVLNFLIGNHDWKGGEMTAGATYEQLTGRYDLNKVGKPNTAWGTPITREKSPYEKSSLFAQDGYPAKRRWYPFGGNLCEEVIPSAMDRYPYPLQALFLFRHSPVTSTPNGAEQKKGLLDTSALPLLVSFDVVIGDSSQYADYVLPDVTYLERWVLEAIYPNQPYKVSILGQPTTQAFEGPRPAEEVFMELFQAMKLPGVGAHAFPEGGDLTMASDWYLKVAANVAYDGTPVPDASAEEQSIFLSARQLALGKNFKIENWQRAVKPEEWPKVVYVLNRGGRFEPPGSEYEGDWIKYRFGGQCNFYDEGAAAAKDSYSGAFFDGLPLLEPVRQFDGSVVDDKLPLQLIGWKARQQGTHRNVSSAWLREVRGTNPLWIHPTDAASRGIAEGDRVRVRSATHVVETVAFLTEGIRPGVVGADFSYGDTGYGASPVEIDGETVQPVKAYGHTPFWLSPLGHEESGYAPGRGEGFLINHVIRTDGRLTNSPLTDAVGGGAAEFDTQVEVEKI